MRPHLKMSGASFDCKLRRVKYLNNVIEQDHRFIRRRRRAAQCFRSFHAAERTLEGVEAMHMMRKRSGQMIGRKGYGGAGARSL
jgi:transposase-like protein